MKWEAISAPPDKLPKWWTRQIKNNYPYGGSIVQTLPHLGALHGTDVPANPVGLIKLQAKWLVVHICLVPSMVICCLMWGFLGSLGFLWTFRMIHRWNTQSWKFQGHCRAICLGACPLFLFLGKKESWRNLYFKTAPQRPFPVVSLSSAHCQQHGVMRTCAASEIRKEWAATGWQCCVAMLGGSQPHAWFPSSVSLVWHDGLAKSICLLSTT